jgi:hypothetical protein
MSTKKTILEIREVVERKPEFIVFTDQYGNQHKYFKGYFSPADWQSLKPERTLEVYTKETLTGIKVWPQKPEMFYVWKLTKEWEDIPVPGYLWGCQECSKRGVVGYEDGDDQQVILRHILQAHMVNSPECRHPNFRIYNHLFQEQRDFDELLALKGVKLVRS